ncbi:MAG: Phosphomannomutase [Candidatus Uhrbacteria bacterium GW2011_GWD2_52_7]|uniref:Phosphomannomutase n=1 Tax=Candidatus Uhrbacteria bacterium GW2011_GWD2_52_7 TaxID=1618989 RepID=A0A0G1XI34_9BACT|nr:MAG: Phosphomannomutase [Candidatus Uhrbacteria bacterium GW2011_GWD2_52_7]
MESTFAPHIFRTYDIRGLLAEVTPELAYAAAMALVVKTGAKNVVIGRDMRSTSPELQASAIAGARDAGADVLDIGMTTTSMYCFAVRHLKAGAGLMVTASHNPPEYNGMKFADATGLPISGRDIREFVEREARLSEERGSVRQVSVLDEYLSAAMHWPNVETLRGTKVIADFGNGMGAMTIRPLAERLGIQLVEMYAEPDARFPNHEANPAKEETLADIKAEMLKGDFDLGVALDGDADRIAFIDNEAQSLRGDLALTIFASEALQKHPGGIVITSPNQSWTTYEEIERLGGRTVDSPIGRTLVIHKMFEVGAVISGEVSSHFFFPEFGNLESVDYAFVRMLLAWKASGKSFADFVRPLRRYANSGEINFSVPDKDAAMSALKSSFAARASSVNELDGIRCDFGRDWWFIVRPSNNEPLIRLTVEGVDDAHLQSGIHEVTAIIESLGGSCITTH